jgi:Tfp pilus assembly protein PilE
MVTISLVSILAIIAMNVYTGYQKKAKMVEAKIALTGLAKLQLTYFTNNDTFTSDLGALEFSFAAGSAQRYVFTINNANASSFTASAEANLDDDAALDVWTINEQRELSHQSVD